MLRAGRSSLAISLPREFIQSNTINQGQELDVTYHGTSLTIRCDDPKPFTKEIDISDISVDDIELHDILEKLVGTFFKQGADTFKIICPDHHTAEIIRGFLRRGKASLYEEPSITAENVVTIRTAITQLREEEADNLTKASIKLIYRTFEDLITHLKEDSLTTQVAKELAKRDDPVNDQTDICRRIINKNVVNYKSTTLYNFTCKLEKIGDTIKYLVQYSGKNVDTVKKYTSLLEELKTYLYLLFSAKTNFSIKKLDEFYAFRNKIKEQIETCKDPQLYYYCKHMHALVKDAFSDLMVKNL